MKTLFLAVGILALAAGLALWWLLLYALDSARDRAPIRTTPVPAPWKRCLAAGVAGLIVSQIALAASFLPPVLALRNSAPSLTGIMVHRGQTSPLPRTDLALADVPTSVLWGVVAIEDSRFYRHQGFDTESIAFAIAVNSRYGSTVYGGSTLTQQLARTLFLSPRKTWERKYQELIIAVELELFLSKGRILELYLNHVEWGPGVYGLAEASRYHFSRAPAELSLDEACRLLVILVNPLRFDTKNFLQDDMMVRRYLQIRQYFGLDRSTGQPVPGTDL